MALINFSGIASGIDSSSLIQAIIDQKKAALVTPYEDKITALQDTNSAFDELSSLLGNLQSAVAKFRTINGGAISKLATSSDETVLTALSSNSAGSGTYSINVTQLASNAIHSFDDRFSSASEKINSSINDGAAEADRTVTIDVGTGDDAESIDVILTSTTTAQEFVSSFNSQSENATANLVNTGTEASPSYAIMISSDTEGTEAGTLAVSVGAEITGNGSFLTSSLQQATDAEFTVSGISGTISRPSNTINDVISGLTLDLQNTGTATVGISADPDATTEILQEFVDAFNEVVNFIAENDTVTREEDGDNVTNIFGPLAETSLDENILSSLRGSLTSSGISGGSVNIFADLGVTTERDGTLKFDPDKFQDALASDPASVETILANAGEEFGAVDGTVAQFIRFNGLIDQTVSSNNSSISGYETRIGRTQQLLSQEEDSLTARFARLESLIGQLNSQQSILTSLLPA